MLNNLINKIKIPLGMIDSHDLEIIKKIQSEGIKLSHVLTSLPTVKNNYKVEFGAVTELQIISLSSFKQVNFDYISELRSLERLSLHSSGIEELPQSLSNLKQLRELYLGFNKLEKIPEFIYEIPKLRTLSIMYNYIESIDEKIENLIYLENLIIHNNIISKIPDSIGKLHRLKIIHLGANRLTEIPIGILRLPNLEDLHLNNNRIENIPSEICNLYGLKYLSLSNHSVYEEDRPLQRRTVCVNAIARIPESMLSMRNIEHIDLYNNPILKNISDIDKLKGNDLILKILSNQNKFDNTVVSKSSYINQNFNIHDKNTKNSELKIFLCHSHADKKRVRQLYDRIKKEGFSPWFDEVDLIAGQNWRLEIPRIVKKSHVVIICLSQNSVTKEGFVQKEIKLSLDTAEEKPEGFIYIMPVQLETCTIPDRLANLHTVNIESEQGITQLIAALKHKHNSLNNLPTHKP